MDWIIHPSRRISGRVTPPPDKSITHRAIMFSALARGESFVENYLGAEDCLSTLAAFQAMGVAVERTPDALRIRGAGIGGLRSPSGDIDCGNSGTTVRLLSGILSGEDVSARLTGDASLSRRPMQRVMEPLRRMGARISARDDNYLPLEITGNPGLSPLAYESPVASAQVKSAILLAGLHARGVTSVGEPLRSRDHTERMLAAAGAKIVVDGLTVSLEGPATLEPMRIRIPGDISSAAFFLVAGAVAPAADIVLSNVGTNPTRDGIVEVLRDMGADIEILDTAFISGEPVSVIRMRSSALKPVTIGAELIPRLIDEIPAIVLAATQAAGRTRITGAGELRVKESDRIRTIALELGRMGARIEELPDGLIVEGPARLVGAEVESHGDHRIAMTLAVAGLIAQGPTRIRDIDCVNTSFPGFLEQLEAAAGRR